MHIRHDHKFSDILTTKFLVELAKEKFFKHPYIKE